MSASRSTAPSCNSPSPCVRGCKRSSMPGRNWAPSNRATSGSPACMDKSSGVRPRRSRCCFASSPPLSWTKSCTTSAWPAKLARCRGVWLRPSLGNAVAPGRLNSHSTTSEWPQRAARCKAVFSKLRSGSVTSCWCSSNHRSTSKWPHWAATSSGVDSCSTSTARSAPRSLSKPRVATPPTSAATWAGVCDSRPAVALSAASPSRSATARSASSSPSRAARCAAGRPPTSRCPPTESVQTPRLQVACHQLSGR
mmetsp:Transcript_95217/g.308328  ORF Transcript_95217/g.308328 Transcript_95217/m.308328 type:complete len:253 (+) Transcript_95217:95-853(+)